MEFNKALRNINTINKHIKDKLYVEDNTIRVSNGYLAMISSDKIEDVIETLSISFETLFSNFDDKHVNLVFNSIQNLHVLNKNYNNLDSINKLISFVDKKIEKYCDEIIIFDSDDDNSDSTKCDHIDCNCIDVIDANNIDINDICTNDVDIDDDIVSDESGDMSNTSSMSGKLNDIIVIDNKEVDDCDGVNDGDDGEAGDKEGGDDKEDGDNNGDNGDNGDNDEKKDINMFIYGSIQDDTKNDTNSNDNVDNDDTEENIRRTCGESDLMKFLRILKVEFKELYKYILQNFNKFRKNVSETYKKFVERHRKIYKRNK